MLYYHVWVRSIKYRGEEPLTYSSSEKLANGTIVEVSLRHETVLGFIISETPKPEISIKPISKVLELPQLPPASLQLASWLRQFYASPIGVITQQFLPKNFSKNILDLATIDPPSETTNRPEPPLTSAQHEALNQIGEPDTYLLHGRTGSGKTRIYTELAKKTLDKGQSALILIPEIGLTSQLETIFSSLFRRSVFTLHSQLTAKQREKAWVNIIRATEPVIVIGPRSSLFCPLEKLGLIVVDEAHDAAYKQEQAPYYHATRVASKLRQIHNCTLILGSATPSVIDYYLAKQKQKKIIRIEGLAIKGDVPHKIRIVDLKDNEQFNRAKHISTALLNAIGESLKKNEQSLLYLNRRGTARVTLCQKCGWQALCIQCDLPLTYHGDNHSLRCHICGKTQLPFTSCPKCKNSSVILHSFGTKAIAEEIKRIFPEARILRFDTDNTKSERIEAQYQTILKREVDILVGTQVIAKGLDLPHLSTLGIIAADASLYLPDFTSKEKTYQLISQVLGRVERGHRESQTIIQTLNPQSELLRQALEKDWEDFYNQELIERKRYLFPPYCHLLKVSCRCTSATITEQKAKTLKKLLDSQKLNITIHGPTPAFHEKSGGKYNWQLVIKSSSRSSLMKVIQQIPKTSEWSYDPDPVDLL